MKSINYFVANLKSISDTSQLCHLLYRLFNIWCICEVCRSHTSNKRSAVQCLKCSDATEVCNRIVFGFYTRLPHNYEHDSVRTKHRSKWLTASFTLILIFWVITTIKGWKSTHALSKTDMKITDTNKITRFQTNKSWASSPLVLLPAYPVQLSDLECVLVMLLVGVHKHWLVITDSGGSLSPLCSTMQMVSWHP